MNVILLFRVFLVVRIYFCISQFPKIVKEPKGFNILTKQKNALWKQRYN